MAANIGGTSCDFVRSSYANPMDRVESWEVLGTEGEGAANMAKGPGPIILVAVKYDTNANIETWREAIEAYKGDSPISAEDDFGESWSSKILVKSVSECRKSARFHQGTLKVRGSITIRGTIQP